MSSIEKQVEANQKNGKLGGVKTPEGKLVSSKNAVKHGILSNCETKYDPVSIDHVFDDLAEEYGVETPSRRFLVEQLALTIIRLHRCARFEAELIREVLNPPKYETIVIQKPLMDPSVIDGKTETKLTHKGEKAVIQAHQLEGIDLICGRYEPRLFSRMLKLIECLKR